MAVRAAINKEKAKLIFRKGGGSLRPSLKVGYSGNPKRRPVKAQGYVDIPRKRR